jgi:hypothetical protein
MVDEPRRRRVEILWELYQRPRDGSLQTAAMALGRDVEGPVFRLDTDKLIEDGAIVLADMPEFGNLGTPELYRVTPKGVQILREWGYPVEH